MTYDEILKRFTDGNVTVPGKKVKFDFGDAGKIFLDGAAGNGKGANGRGINGALPVEIPLDDFTKEELLNLEKETLGLYVSSHPLKDIRYQVRREAGHLISQLGDLPDGTITTIVGMVGTTQAAEALKLILNCGTPLAGRLLLLDGLAMEWRSVAFGRDSGCAVCGGRGEGSGAAL